MAAKRTPFGTYGGKFLKKSITDLQEVANKAAITAAGLKPDQIDSVVIGNVNAVSRMFYLSSKYHNLSHVACCLLPKLSELLITKIISVSE